MNYKMIFNIIGRVLLIESMLLIMPLIVSFIYKENIYSSYLITILIALTIGCLLLLITKKRNKTIYAKEGLITVALSWVFVSIIGAIPFTISKDIPNYIDALFETVSGFSTTGASILSYVENLNHSSLFWRSFTHWIGGMGIIVFVIAIMGNTSDKSIHVLRAEMPGPTVDKLVPRSKNTAKILYLIYIALTISLIILLLCGGMNLFESVTHAFGTAGTGGFGIKNNSLEGYNSYIQWVIAIYMFLFGINFNIYYFILLKKIKYVIKNTEFLTYIIIAILSITTIAVNICLTMNYSIGEAIRHSAFQVGTCMSTTGYSTQNFDLWPTLSKSILFILMFIGGSAGSTAGGLKVSRVIILLKKIKQEVKHFIYPNCVTTVKLDSKVDESTTSNVVVYYCFYMIIIFTVFLLISIGNNFGIETNFSASVSCFNNIGPGFSGVGPYFNYASYSYFAKIVLTIAMLLGRLEIFPMLILFLPSVYKKN